jgi:hypothetical protein
VRRPLLPVVVVAVGVVLLADLLVVNPTLDDVAGAVVEMVILVAAGAAIAAVASLAWRRGGDLWRRRGDPVGAALVLVGIAAMLMVGLRPGSAGASDPAVRWLVGALVVPIAATLFSLLFVTTLAAARRAVAARPREALILVGAALLVLVLVLPFGGDAGIVGSTAAGWLLDGPIAAVLRGVLLGAALLAAVAAARTLLGIGSADE